jgi:glycosyltransferase involved in cell wall biosynthesis
MKVSIIFCHFKTGKMSAYAVSQLLKCKGDHEIEILISDNNAGDGTIEYLKPFADHIKIFDFPKDRMQSHGAGYDFLIEKATHENIVTMESDSYPTKDGWLDFYEGLMNQGIEWAGSLLRLSGGTYVHPAVLSIRNHYGKKPKTIAKTHSTATSQIWRMIGSLIVT